MAFDAAPRPEPSPGPSSGPPAREPYDWGDFALRTVVIVPLMGLYGWWVFGILRTAWNALTGQL